MEPCVHQDPGERSSDPTETEPDMPVSGQESLVKAWVDGQGHGIQQSWEHGMLA